MERDERRNNDFYRAQRVLAPTLDTIDIFFGAYLMTRYTAYMTTKEEPHEQLEEAQKVAVIAFVFAAIFTFLVVVVRNYEAALWAVFLTALTASVGTLCGLMGVTIMKTGLICSGLAIVSVLQQIFGFGFPGILGGISGAISTGNKIGTSGRASGIITGIFIGIMVDMVVVLAAVLVGLLVAFLLISGRPANENDDRNVDLMYVGLPTAVCSSLTAGFVIWLCDGFVLHLIDDLKELPDGFALGALLGIIIGFVFGSNFGFVSCLERNRQTVIVVVSKGDDRKHDKKRDKSSSKKKKA